MLEVLLAIVSVRREVGARDGLNVCIASPELAATRWERDGATGIRLSCRSSVPLLPNTQYRPATANKMLAVLRGVLQECWRLGLMSAEEYQRARDLKTIKAETLPRGRALTVGEKGLLGACAQDPRPAGARDAPLSDCCSLYGGGLRRSEAVQLNLTDYTPASAEIRVLDGKGR